MTGTRPTGGPPTRAATAALTEARRRSGPAAPTAATGPTALLALQRDAGNGAVSALLAAKLRNPADSARDDIDGALHELRGDDPALPAVEKGLKAAKDAGVPVEIEGPKPPASALAVVRTGFGPAAVAPPKPPAPPKPLPAVHPLGKAAAKAGGGHVGAAGKGGATGGARPGTAAPTAATGGAGVATAPLAAEQLLQPPVAPTGTRPDDDPAFAQVAHGVAGVAAAKRSHPAAATKATEAQGAALAPADDVAGQAKAAKADAMDAQQPGSFDKKGFIAAVKSAIEAKSPKTLEEATDHPGASGDVKGDVKGLVSQGKGAQTKDIAAATAAAPDASKAVAKPVTPMVAEDPGAPGTVAAGGAAPKPAPAEQLNLGAGKAQADQELKDAEVTEPQLANSNEPEFHQALTDKNTAAQHADTAPGEYRAHEANAIDQSKEHAGAQAAAGLAGMHGGKVAALASLAADKGATKSKDEAKRAEVTTKIQGIFDATETEVRATLDGLDPQVDKEFETGEAAAKAAFESYVAAKMSAYKEDRYSGWLGGLRWAKDKLLGMPSAVDEFYAAGRELYLQRMDGVISRVADIVGTGLGAAKARIAKGRADIATYVKSLPTDLQKVGAEASSEIGDRFGELEKDVDSKQDALVDSLASKYVEARKGLDERIEALQAENKGLVDKAIGAIKGVIDTIRGLVSMLTTVLARAAGVIGDIIKDPIGFLGNLVSGVKGGIDKFFGNIEKHLREGLMGWLFGALAEGGIELPETFDVKGILKLIASIFGLTWSNIRSRIVKQIGEKAMGAVEKGVEIFQIISTQGIGGLWEMLVDKLGDIKEMILEKVRDFVITKIITAGITWLISLLNPAAAFIKACKMIYDVIMFFVNNGERIMAFVNTVIDSVADIVKGNVSGVVDKIEDVLGKLVPILIGFLASALGLGGIGEKIREIVDTLRKPVNKALDFVVKQGLRLAGPVIRLAQGVAGKAKAGIAKGMAYVKGKVDAGKKWVGGKVAAGREWAADKIAAGRAALARTLSKGFSVDGMSHTFAAEPDGSGRLNLTIATVKKTVKAHHADMMVANEMALADNGAPLASGKKKTKKAPDLKKEIKTSAAKGAELEIQANAANADPVKLRASINEFTELVGTIWLKLGYNGTPPKTRLADGTSTKGSIGDMTRHGDQGTRGWRGPDTRGLLDQLESEHVIPRGWIIVFLDEFLGVVKRGSKGDDSLYRAMTTIMMYRTASEHKTNNAKIGDNIALPGLKKLARGQLGKDPSVVAAKVREAFDGPLRNRVKQAYSAVLADHKERSRPGDPRPTHSEIETAGARQLLDVIEFLTRILKEKGKQKRSDR